MAHVKSGFLASAPEWAKHLRSFNKRRFWKRHRKVENSEARQWAGDKPKHRVTSTRAMRNYD